MKLVTIFISVILLSCAFAYVSSLPKMTGSGRAVTSEMTPVELSLPNGTQLRIPKAYLVKVKNWQGGTQKYINLDILLPDAIPTEPDRKYKNESIVQITLKDMTASNLENWFSKVDEVKPYLQPTQFELQKLNEDFFKKENIDFPGSYPPREDVYYAKMPNRFVKINCRTIPLEVNCVVETNFGLIKSSYILSRLHVPQGWVEIDQKVQRLVESFTSSSGEK